jgi:hypothetical protein
MTTELDLEKQISTTKSVRLSAPKAKKLKSAASVMQSSQMGYGFGDSKKSTPSPVLSRFISLSFLCLIPRPSRPPETASQILLSTDAVNSTTAGYCLPMDLRVRMVRDCCAGVAFLHSKGLVHCDIKSLNFLVTNEFVVKLSDLGEARPLKGTMDRNKMPKLTSLPSLSLTLT